MICDAVDNFIEKLPLYMPRCAELSGFLRAAREKSFEELKKTDFSPLDVRFDEYETAEESETPFEAHRKFWDLQIVMEGEEFLGYAPVSSLSQTAPYDESEDTAFYEGSGSYVRLSRGRAALLAPWDGHRPGVRAEAPSFVKKIVVKLAW